MTDQSKPKPEKLENPELRKETLADLQEETLADLVEDQAEGARGGRVPLLQKTHFYCK